MSKKVLKGFLKRQEDARCHPLSREWDFLFHPLLGNLLPAYDIELAGIIPGWDLEDYWAAVIQATLEERGYI